MAIHIPMGFGGGGHTCIWPCVADVRGESPVGGGQTIGTDMLPLRVFMAVEATVGVELLACLSSWFGQAIVGPDNAASLLHSPQRGVSGIGLAVDGGMPD